MKRNSLLLAIVIALSAFPAHAQVSESPTLLPGAAQTVFDYYFKIQTTLAKDSMEGVAVNASVIAAIARKDPNSGFPLALADQAEALAGAKDIVAARQTFKAVSGYLIQYAETSHTVAGTYHEVHCPMANVNWLQNDDKTVRNPYLGKSMPQCGAFKS